MNEQDSKTLLQWHARYSVGIDAIDCEHQELIDLINRILAALLATYSKEGVCAFLGDLFRAISAHFALEEKFMRDCSYDQLDTHKVDHERLLDEIRDIMEDFERSDVIHAADLANRLDIWFS